MTLKDDGKGTINVMATPDKSTYNFTNEYEATGKTDLKAKMAITGASWPEGGKVTFTVTAANGVPMPEKPTVSLTAAGDADFGSIKYTIGDAGKTYTYTIKETSGFGSGWTAVPDKITVTVVVGEDNGDGTLKECKVTYSPNEATITNKFTSQNETEKKPTPNTGDNTPITLYLILFLATAMIILEESIRRLRKGVHKK